MHGLTIILMSQQSSCYTEGQFYRRASGFLELLLSVKSVCVCMRDYRRGCKLNSRDIEPVYLAATYVSKRNETILFMGVPFSNEARRERNQLT